MKRGRQKDFFRILSGCIEGKCNLRKGLEHHKISIVESFCLTQQIALLPPPPCLIISSKNNPFLNSMI